MPQRQGLSALIYTRVSEDRSGGRSPVEQEAEAREVCADNGWTVAEVITDSVGASRYSKGKRPGWERCKALIESGEVGVLVVWEASRAQRDLAAYTELRALCERTGTLWSYDGKTYDMRDADDRHTTGSDALDAEKESAKISKRVKRAMRSSAVAGRPPGRRLFGYRRLYDPDTGRLVGQEAHPDEAPVVRSVFAMYLAGNGPRTIARTLNDAGTHTAKGSRWTDVQVRRMLRTESYAARRVHRGEVVGPANWPPLVDPETFDKVQARLDEVRARTPKSRGTSRLLSGVARCGVCGGKVATIHDRKNRKVYACREGFHVGRDMLKLDAYVTAVVVERLSRPDATEALAGSGPDPATGAARDRVTSIRAQLDDAVDQFTAGNLSGAMLAKVEQRLRPQLEEAERATRRAYVGLALDAPTEGVAQWWETLTPEVRRSVVGALVDAVVILPTGRGRAPFNPDDVRIEWRR